MKKIERQLKRLQQLMTVLIGRDHFKGIIIDKADKKFHAWISEFFKDYPIYGCEILKKLNTSTWLYCMEISIVNKLWCVMFRQLLPFKYLMPMKQKLTQL